MIMIGLYGKVLTGVPIKTILGLEVGVWRLMVPGSGKKGDILNNPRNLRSIQQMHAEMATDDFKKPRHQDRRRMIKWAKTLARELGTSEPPPLR